MSDIEKKIEQFRNKLNNLIIEKDLDLQDKEVIKLSKILDEYINKKLR